MTAPPDTGPAAVAQENSAAPALADGKTTTFVFSHILFKTPGARFVGAGGERTPMFAVDLGDTKGLLGIRAMKNQFKIPPGSADDKMIDLAVRSLRYVTEIRPGDNVPNEILTGRASWSIDSRHTEVARRRLEMQLLATVDSKEVKLRDTREITAYLEQPENKAKLREAFRGAAKAMGRKEDDYAYVLDKLTTFARELAYIEALREWFLQVGAILKKIQWVGKAYDGDRRVTGEVSQMRSLFMPVAREYRDIFTMVDAMSSDVVSALSSIHEKVGTVREARDKLHHLTLIWRDTVVQWRNCTPDNAVAYLNTARTTYRFLATRHSSGRSLLKAKTVVF
ncbi:MAG: hypothetical protein AB7E79_08635 [Rhodospirillaceae bacterium]